MLVIYVVIFSNFVNVFGFDNNEENIYKELPPIFRIDNYEKCKMEGKLFCKASIILKPSGQNVSRQWKLIQHSIESNRAYNHDELFHAICVNDFCPELSKKPETHLRETVAECYQQKFLSLGLSANLINLNCTNLDNIHKPGIVDCLWLLFITAYLTYIFIATYWDFQNREMLSFSQKFGQHFLLFSILSNYKKFKKINSSQDFQKLKCIQGIRFYNMLLIIFCHTYSSYIGGYVMNTEYMEDIPNNPIRHGIRNLMAFLVQTFFLFSAFLMSYHFFQIMENNENGSNKVKVVWLTFINRYLRIVPPVGIMLGVGCTMWVVNLFYGPIKDLYAYPEYLRCQKNWWTTLLFINNHYNQHDMCYFTTWYLAADTQLYLLSLIIMAMIWKYKQNTRYILLSFVALGTVIPIVISYIYDLDIIFRITPENSKINKFRSFKFHAIYSSTYANMATYMVGLCFGYVYFNLRHTNIYIPKAKKLVWYAAFVGLPLLVITISSNYYSRIISAILSGILKPLYAIGIAIGVFGMSRGIGGVIRKICEWEPTLILGNLTYSTYIVHYVIVFYRTADATQPFYVSDFVLITSFIQDAVLSFLCGFILHLLVELPAANLQNMYMPQVRYRRVRRESPKIK